MRVSITAARSARLSAASSVCPLGLTARSSGHDAFVVVGGNACSAGASRGGGTGMTPARRAVPVRGSILNTAITSPARPGMRAGTRVPRKGDCAIPETYAVRPFGAIAIPPSTPGIRMSWITRPLRTSTIRMSLRPRPADKVQRKRPSGVSAPPVGKLPSSTRRPAG